MFPAARKGDAIKHGGAVVTGSPSVFINGLPAALVGLSCAVCGLHPSAQAVVLGSSSVTINSLPAAFAGCLASCGSPIATGSMDVLIGS
ncbi:PAAR domain-containing protein [Paraburkholderia sp. MMS20-SJTR3]|uniref:PAAR domain-containing protein n=1 Tax=Paraburkholderia sejongensis TaxID=2886946 RepID=A0ABS8K0K7_9BURK|nr:PAAR domain-containing protein [Paraburkholderia sp. MMS20-SJTR3]MCC8395690.1 PAAR domain-containing protein [Paraburkholderia sp. MMS20-SJTR3]